MASYPPDLRVVHALPPAPHFVGRQAELAEVRRLWGSGFQGVVALVGLGGAGKTAVAAQFLRDLLNEHGSVRPASLLVWSFYQEPDAGRFLQEVLDYWAGGVAASVGARGAGLLHLIREALSAGGRQLVVLDGLERVQRPGDSSTTTYGQLEDPLLKGLLTRLAEGTGDTMVLATSRFPLTDLELFRGAGYQHLDVGGLDAEAGQALLRAHGVHGDESILATLVANYGAHALTLDHLGALIGQFLEGDAARAPEAPSATPSRDRQALRLARLLRAYEEYLPPAELALLCRLCLLRRSVREEQIVKLFLCTPAVHARTVRELADQVARLPEKDPKSVKSPLDLADSIRATLEEALCVAPIAGPEELFRQEVWLAAEKVWALINENVTVDFQELNHLYAGTGLDVPTDERPLPPGDRQVLRQAYAFYTKLQQHPQMPYKVLPVNLETAFIVLGYKGESPEHFPADMTPADLLSSLRQTRRTLQCLLCKHFALRRVCELCRAYQKKWVLAGPLAPLDAPGLREVLNTLVGRHLVLREGDGSFSVHPAVRDHFSALAAGSDPTAWHHIIREQLISLVQRPGKQLPEDSASLDLVEEAIYHAQQAGRPRDAAALYEHVLGGLRHLGWKLGEMARGLRILRQLSPCPDPWALAWFLRALGEFAEAFDRNAVPSFRADIRLLQGHLPWVAGECDSARDEVAAFLMGQASKLPPAPLGCVIPRQQILVYLDRPLHHGLESAARGLYHDLGWESERARCQVWAAEACRSKGNLRRCREHLAEAAVWILHAGSVEHLCVWQLMRARAARSGGEGEAAQRAAAEGLHLARQCGLGLYHIELLCEQAAICLARADSPAAEQVAGEALERAAATDCRFAWGEAEAGHLLGEALANQQRRREARTVLRKTLRLRRRIGDPRAWQTQELLAGLRR
jgi:hypothetical protein